MSYESEPGLFRIDDAEEIVLRESYQVPSIEALRDNIRKGVKSQILASMVGSGKTVMGAYLLKECWEKGKRGVFVVDRESLLGQTSRVLDRYGIPHGVIQGGHSRYRPGELIQVAMMQTLARRGWPDADLILIDECHINYKTATDKIVKEDARIIGLTATPFTRGLGRHYKALVNVTTGNKLTKDGFLVPFKVWASSEPDMKGVKTTKFGEWEEEETSKRAVKIVGDVVREYQDKGNGGKAIAFGVDVAHCEAMQLQFLQAGINAQLYTYHTQDEEREMLIGENGEFRKSDSKVRVLISVAALSRGFDVPDTSVILMCRPLRNSFAEFIQVIGRGLRPSPGKSHAIILDLAGNFMRHYPAMVEFFEEGAQTLDDGKPKPKKPAIPAEKKPRKCVKCSFLPVIADCCPACGYIMRRASRVQHAQGELTGFDGGKAIVRDRGAKELLWAELRFIAQDRDYKRGWPIWKYRFMTGTKPPFNSNLEPQIPRRETLRAVGGFKRKASPPVAPARQKPAPAILAQSRAIPETRRELDLFT